MTATKYTGVKYHDAKDGTRTYYIVYKENGKLKRKKIGTKAEGVSPTFCKNLRDQTLVKLRLGEAAPIKGRKQVKTLSEVSVEYFESGGKKGELRSKSKLQSLYKHLSHLGNEPVTYFNDDTLLTLKNKKKTELSKKTKRVLSKQTVNNILTLLSAILNFAESKKYLAEAPALKKIDVDPNRDRFLTTDEINALYVAIEESNIRTKDRVLLFTKLALMTGARLNSILTITGKDINRTNKTVTLKNHKTGNTYTAFIPPALMELIAPLKLQERLIDVADPKQIQRPLQGILNDLFNEELELDDRKNRVVIHTLRHTFASHLATNGVPILKIRDLMNHANIKTTMIYAKFAPDAGRDDIERLYE